MNANFGQLVLCLPAIDTVIVHRGAVTDEFAVARNLGKTTCEPTKVTAGDFLKIAEAVVALKFRGRVQDLPCSGFNWDPSISIF